jgi:ArsR family transcriptional regulator
MPLTRIEEFKAKDIRLSGLAKALAHPARVAILRTLAKRNACVCGEIVDVLPIAQATVSQHLKELRNAGLVDGTVEGSSSCYCLNSKAIDEMAEQLNAFFDELRGGCVTTSCSTKGKSK